VISAFFFLLLAALLFWVNKSTGQTWIMVVTGIGFWVCLVVAIVLAVAAP